MSNMGLQSFFAPPSPMTNSTATPAGPQSPLAFLFSFSSGFSDWIKLAILGAIVEFARRSASWIWATFVASFVITANFDGEDDAYDWMMVWLSKKNTWRKARELQVSTRNYSSNRFQGNDYDEIVILDEGQTESMSKGRILNFLPSFGTSSTFVHAGHLMRATRERTQVAYSDRYLESLTISILGRNHGVLRELLLEAQKEHKAQEANRVGVYIADNYNSWRWSGSRPKRPLQSIILDQGVKEKLIDDAKDFLSSEEWYAARGIPFRRGYLLHGAPGSGKTSLIHAVAGTLGLDIYVISLSKKGLDDSSLNELICDLPSRSIALIEDIDAAFTHGVSREGVAGSDDDKETPGKPKDPSAEPSGPGVTLSGLLGAIDGVAAQEGRILFATTNRYHVLDPALVRPGRLDLHIEFTLASSWQAGEIFKCFYPAQDEAAAPNGEIDIGEKEALLSAKPQASYNLTTKERDELAARFAAGVPDRVTSMAALQGHLMAYKTRPVDAVENIKAFIEIQCKKKDEKKTAIAEPKLEAPGSKSEDASAEIPLAPKDSS